MQNSKADYAMEAILYVIRYWRKVYFSSAIQWEQKSPSPLLPDSASNVVQKFCALEWGVSWMAGLHAPTGWGWPDELHPTDPAHAAETGMGCRGRTEPSNPNQDRSTSTMGGWDAHPLAWPAHPCRGGNLPGWYVSGRLHTWKRMEEYSIILSTLLPSLNPMTF